MISLGKIQRKLDLAGVAAGFLVLGCALVFGQTLWFEFVAWDDPVYILENQVVRAGIGWETIGWAFTSRFFGLWQPLSWMSHMLDVSLWGVSSAGHHLSSLLIHAAASLILLVLLRECGISAPRAFLVAFIFALHPLRAESVAWVSERKDVLCVFWLMVSCWAHVRWARTSIKAYLAFSVVASLLALLSKPLAVVAPALLLLLDRWPLAREESVRQLLMEKVGHVLVACLGVAMAFFYKSGAAQAGLSEGGPVVSGLDKLWVVTHAVWIHAFNQFWPVNLAFFHPLEFETLWIRGVLGLVFLGGLLYLSYGQRNARPWVTTGILWYLIALAPSSGVVQISHFAYADRYSYLPSIGLLLALVMTVQLPASPAMRRVAYSGLGLVMVVMVALSVWQVSHWRNSESLFKRALAVYPNNPVAHIKLAEHYFSTGLLEMAETHAIAARAPHESKSFEASRLEQLGKIAFVRRDYTRAKMLWHQGLSLMPQDQGLHCDLGTLALEVRDNSAALFHFEQCRLGQRVSSGLWNNYGVALERAGRWQEAELAYRKAIEIDGKNLGAIINLAKRAEFHGAVGEALALYERANQIVPNHPQTLAGLRRLQGVHR